MAAKTEEIRHEKRTDDGEDPDSQLPQTEVNENTSNDKDGKRMIHLRDALRKTIKKCMDSAKFSIFSKQYGNHMLDRKPEVLKRVYQQFKKELETSIKTELELVIKEENLVPLFNELDRLAEVATDDTAHDAWRPSGEPEKDCLSQRMNAKLKEKERLKRILRQTEEEGQQLLLNIRSHKMNLVRTQAKIKDHLEAFSQASAAADQVPVSEIHRALKELNSPVSQQ
ncbi:polyamine-modulated factor 1-like [Diadema antillarum]|uniref:polyamine-modulated factor 1-like n=1 Tax=Diadema antillarum TaxID=105358 RepID=UPI003A88987C